MLPKEKDEDAKTIVENICKVAVFGCKNAELPITETCWAQKGTVIEFDLLADTSMSLTLPTIDGTCFYYERVYKMLRVSDTYDMLTDSLYQSVFSIAPSTATMMDINLPDWTTAVPSQDTY